MERKDLIAALGRMKVETGSLVCLGCGHEHNCGVHGCAILREAVAQLEASEICDDKPLTLEQLREMDGQPVWIERRESDSPVDKEWALVFCKEKFCRTSRGNIALFFLYGIGWLAYAYLPEHKEDRP